MTLNFAAIFAAKERKDRRELDFKPLTRIFHGATVTSPWFARQPQRGRCGSSKQSVARCHSECE